MRNWKRYLSTPLAATRKIPRRGKIGLVLCITTIIALTTGARAFSGASPTIYYACVDPTTRVLTQSDATTPCPNNGAKINWNQQGPRGEKGEKGDEADTGDNCGIGGIIGTCGGFLGAKGSKGDTGPQGPAGPKGDKGEPGIGIPGIPGPKGDTGPAGPSGPAGLKGDTGPAGPKGDAGLQGPAGPKGDKGDTGPQGPAGPAGPPGPAGLPGPQGFAGERELPRIFRTTGGSGVTSTAILVLPPGIYLLDGSAQVNELAGGRRGDGSCSFSLSDNGSVPNTSTVPPGGSEILTLHNTLNLANATAPTRVTMFCQPTPNRVQNAHSSTVQPHVASGDICFSHVVFTAIAGDIIRQ